MDRNQRASRLSKMREEAHRKWVCGALKSFSLGGMGPMSTLKVCSFDKETHGTSVDALGDENNENEKLSVHAFGLRSYLKV